jgi:DNA-binding GntR family transcriptional regulator
MSRTEEVYRQIRKEIFLSRYRPDEFIVEKEMAARYGVSRGTAAEALSRLCMDGHLKSYPRKGYLVALASEKELGQIQRLRFTIESLSLSVVIDEAADGAVGLLYPLLDKPLEEDSEYGTMNERFHIELAKLGGDRYIVESLRNLIGALTRTATFASVAQRYSGQEFHQGMLDSVAKRNKTRAISCLREDLFR